MSLMEQIGAKRFAPGKGVEKASPSKGPARFFFLFANYFWRLIGINMLFVLCCLPIFTIPASLCALNRYLINMVRDGYGFSIGDYWKEWKTQLLKSLPTGILCAFPLGYAYYLLSMSAGRDGSGMLFTFGLFWGFIGLILNSYVYILSAMLDLPLRLLLKNALILIVCEWKTSLCVLCATGLTLMAGWLLFPYSVSVLVVCWFSWLHLALCCMINEPVQKRIIGPYEKMQHKETSKTRTGEMGSEKIKDFDRKGLHDRAS